MKPRTPVINSNVDAAGVVREALGLLLPRVAEPSRRRFLRRALTLGGVSMLAGCSITDDGDVEAALSAVSRFNDRVQG